MKKSHLIVIFIIVCLYCMPDAGQSCTSFGLNQDELHLFGKNLDWDLDDGLVFINKRGALKKAIPAQNDNGEPVSWKSKYGSITFNQYGREIAMGGMNEAGLTVETMVLGMSQYPPPDARPYIPKFQWQQYQLDTAGTVAEVIDSLMKIRVSGGGKGPGVHFLVIDKTGVCAAIEFLNGKTVVHTRETLPIKVLTNSTYTQSLETFNQTLNQAKESFANLSSSLYRFVTAADMIKRYDDKNTIPTIDNVFHILKKVSQGRQTKWSIAYDIGNLKIYFRTYANPKIRHINLKAFDFTCQTPVKVLGINAKLEGDVSAAFTDYTQSANRKLIGEAFRKTSFLRNVPVEELDQLSRYPEETICE